VVNQDDARAEGQDIGHVVTGEDDGHAAALVVFGEKAAEAELHRNIKAEGGFIKE